HLPPRSPLFPYTTLFRSEWIGLENFLFLIGDTTARLSLFNTLFYTVVASVLKFVLGLWLALLLNRHLPFKSAIRAVVLLPFIVRSEEHTSELQSLAYLVC